MRTDINDVEAVSGAGGSAGGLDLGAIGRERK